MSFKNNNYSFGVTICSTEVRSDVMYHAGIVLLIRGFFSGNDHSITRNVVNNVNALDLSTESLTHSVFVRALSCMEWSKSHQRTERNLHARDRSG